MSQHEREQTERIMEEMYAEIAAIKRELDEAVKLLDRPCPHDTNGDGDCGAPGCPYCGLMVRAFLDRNRKDKP